MHNISRFINRKKDHEVYVKWYQGFVTDPKTGKLRDSCYLDPVPDPLTGQVMRKIDSRNSFHESFVSEIKFDHGDFKQDDVKVDVARLSDDIPDSWIRHTSAVLL